MCQLEKVVSEPHSPEVAARKRIRFTRCWLCSRRNFLCITRKPIMKLPRIWAYMTHLDVEGKDVCRCRCRCRWKGGREKMLSGHSHMIN